MTVKKSCCVCAVVRTSGASIYGHSWLLRVSLRLRLALLAGESRLPTPPISKKDVPLAR